MIYNITIVTAQGVKLYQIGEMVNGVRLHKIESGYLHFTGDPFDHYIGYAETGEILFTINCLVPCIVEFQNK